MLYIQKGTPSQTVSLKIAEIKRRNAWKELPLNSPETQNEKAKYTTVLRGMFDEIPKDDIRSTLVKEQHYLCAYCMRKITDEKDVNNRVNMRIEHWYPLSNNKIKAIEYSNFLAACEGIDSQNGEVIKCCDNSKESSVIHIDPRDKRMMSLITYDSDGRISVRKADGWSQEEIDTFQKDIDEVLLLNGSTEKKYADKNSELKMYRSAVYKACAKRLSKLYLSGKLTKKAIQEIVDSIEKSEHYPEYAGVMLFYYKRWLKNHGC